MSIQESRRLAIVNRVFSLEKLRGLAGLLWEEYNTSTGELKPMTITKRGIAISFFAEATDHSTFQSESLSLFDSDSVINRKKIFHVKFEFQGENGKGILIEIFHANEQLPKNGAELVGVTSFAIIKGTDSKWVNGVARIIDEFLDSIPPQESILISQRKLFNWCIFILFVICSWLILDLYNGFGPFATLIQTLNDENGILSGILVAIAGSFFFGGLPYLFLKTYVLDNLEKIWPIIEIQIGPEHRLVEKRRRRLLAYLITGIIIPVILAVVSLIF